MEKIEVYSSRKKSIILLVISLCFVAGGIYMFINAEDFIQHGLRSLGFIQSISIAGILFFGIGLFLSVKMLIKDRLMLIIDKNGINVNPNKHPDNYIDWQFIKGFSELSLQGQKIIIIEVSNADYWPEKETNAIRKKIMKFNITNYGSPFNLSAGTMKINHAQLLNILQESLTQSKVLA